MRLGPVLDAALAESIRAWARSGMVRRLWAKDAGVWTGGDEARWLGWLDVATVEAPLEALAALTREVGAAGLTDVLLLGMGGSSLCPEVLSRVLGPVAGAPVLHVLDSTDPAQIRRTESRLDLSRTLCIVSSKSGTTLEPTILTEYFLDRVRQRVGAEEAGSRFVAVTDPGSALEVIARAAQFRQVWHGVPAVGTCRHGASGHGRGRGGVDRPNRRTETRACGSGSRAARRPGRDATRSRWCCRRRSAISEAGWNSCWPSRPGKRGGDSFR